MTDEEVLAGRDCAAVFNYVDPKFDRQFLNDEKSNGNIGS